MLQIMRFLATVLGGGGRAGQIARIGATATGGGALGTVLGGQLTGGGGGGPRRRRRRRVFNSQDRADIAFITATLGQTAGTKVAMIMAASN